MGNTNNFILSSWYGDVYIYDNTDSDNTIMMGGKINKVNDPFLEVLF